MKKRITITIECETNKDDEYIQKVMKRGTFRALDTSPYYISSPGMVENIDVEIYTHPEEIIYHI